MQAGGTRRYRPINAYDILFAGAGVNGDFAGATVDLDFLDPSVHSDDRSVYLTLRRNDVDFRMMGTQGNQTRLARVLNETVATATGSLADVVNTVYDLSDAEAVDAMASMTGVVHRHVARASLGEARSFMGVSTSRLGSVARGPAFAGLAVNRVNTAGVQAGLAAAEQPGREATRGWWVAGMGGLRTLRGTEGDPSARVEALGMVVGFDAALTSKMTVGIIGAGAAPRITLGGPSDRAEMQTWQAGVYGRYRTGRSRIDFAAGGGRQRHSTERAVTDGVRAWTAGASYRGRTLASQVEYGYTLNLGRRFRLEPSLGVQYTGLRTDPFAEAGAGALNLGVPERQVRSGRSLVGGRLEKQLGTSSRTVTVEGRASWARELTPLTDVTMHLAGDSARNGLLLRATDQPRNVGLFGGAIVVEVPRQLQLLADLDMEVSGLVKAWRASAGMRMGW